MKRSAHISYNQFLPLALSLILGANLGLGVSAAEKSVNETKADNPDKEAEAKIEEKAESKPEEKDTKPVYYTLVAKNYLPENDEFYVKSIFKRKGVPSALISRSNNTRSGASFLPTSTYRVGDKLNEDLLITDIVTGVGRRIELKQLSSGKEFILRMGYGVAKSRLIPKTLEKKPEEKTASEAQ